MRVLINYATYADRVTIHCLADDARTVIAPFKPVSSLEARYRLISDMSAEILSNAERKSTSGDTADAGQM